MKRKFLQEYTAQFILKIALDEIEKNYSGDKFDYLINWIIDVTEIPEIDANYTEEKIDKQVQDVLKYREDHKSDPLSIEEKQTRIINALVEKYGIPRDFIIYLISHVEFEEENDDASKILTAAKKVEIEDKIKELEQNIGDHPRTETEIDALAWKYLERKGIPRAKDFNIAIRNNQREDYKELIFDYDTGKIREEYLLKALVKMNEIRPLKEGVDI